MKTFTGRKKFTGGTAIQLLPNFCQDNLFERAATPKSAYNVRKQLMHFSCRFCITFIFSVSKHNNVQMNIKINSHDISRDIWAFSRYFKILFVPRFIEEPLNDVLRNRGWETLVSIVER